MKITVMDPNYVNLKEFDAYESLIWVDRYNKLGDFEVCLPIEKDTMSLFVSGNMVTTENSKHGMFINYMDCSTSAESGSKLIVKGVSFENILYRRVIWKQTRLQGNFQNGVERLLNENIINPEDPNRRISNFVFVRSEDPAIRRITVDRQFTGDNLGEAIEAMCFELGVGFQVLLNEDNMFEFSLYKGLDRTFAQDKNNYVEFSIPLENLINSKYVESDENYKNVSLVAGEGEGSRRITAIAGNANATGLNRYELYTDARDISTVKDSEGEEDEYYTDAEYQALLIDRGNKYLLEHEKSRVFDSQAETNLDFTYGVDYYIGDIVQTKDGYGHEGYSRVTEYIMSYNESGYTAYPTFDVVYDATDIKDDIQEPDTLQVTVYNPHNSSTVVFNADSFENLPYGFTPPNSDYNWPGPAMVLLGCEYPFAYFSDLFAYGDYYHIRVTIKRIRDNRNMGTFQDCICRYSVVDRVDPNYTKEGYLQYGDHSGDQDPDDPDDLYEPEDPDAEEDDPDSILWPIHYRVTVKSDWKGTPYESVTEFGIESFTILPGGYDADSKHYDPPAIALNGCRIPSSELTRIFSNSSVPKSFTITPDKDSPGSTSLVRYDYPPFRDEVDQPPKNDGDILTKGDSIITCYSVHMGSMEVGEGGARYVETAYFDYVFDSKYFWDELPDKSMYIVTVMDQWASTLAHRVIDIFNIEDYEMLFEKKDRPAIRLTEIDRKIEPLQTMFNGTNPYGFTIVPSNTNTNPKKVPENEEIGMRTTKYPPYDKLTKGKSVISCFYPKVFNYKDSPLPDYTKFADISYKFDNKYNWGESVTINPDYRRIKMIIYDGTKFIGLLHNVDIGGTTNDPCPLVVSSVDGLSWDFHYLPKECRSGTLNDIEYGNGVYVIVGDRYCTARRLYSYDLDEWFFITYAQDGLKDINDYKYVFFMGGQFVAISGTTRAVSSDGIHWEIITGCFNILYNIMDSKISSPKGSPLLYDARWSQGYINVTYDGIHGVNTFVSGTSIKYVDNPSGYINSSTYYPGGGISNGSDIISPGAPDNMSFSLGTGWQCYTCKKEEGQTTSIYYNNNTVWRSKYMCYGEGYYIYIGNNNSGDKDPLRISWSKNSGRTWRQMLFPVFQNNGTIENKGMLIYGGGKFLFIRNRYSSQTGLRKDTQEIYVVPASLLPQLDVLWEKANLS